MTISRKKMQELDKRAIEKFGISSIVLMENAAMACFEKLRDKNSFTIVCGSGNNGGDGLALARHLILNKKKVDVFVIKELKTDEAKENLNILKKLTEKIFYISEDADLLKLKNSLNENEVVVDCIFGVGLSREIEGIYRDVIEIVNESGKYRVSIDIPSGLDADTGEILGVAVRAEETIAIHDIKTGMLKNKNCGKLQSVYIGIPDESFEI